MFKQKAITALDCIAYWSIVLIPFFMGIAPAPMNIFMGFLIFVFLAKKILKNDPWFAKTAINTPLLLFFIVSCLSVFNSVNLTDSFKGGILRLFMYIFVFFALVDSIKDQKHLKRIFAAMIFGVVLVSIDEIWQVFTGSSFIRPGYAPVVNIGLVRATSSFKDSNTLGIYLSAIAPVLFCLGFYSRTPKNKLVLGAASLLVLSGVVLTYSRPTLLAVYIALWFLCIVAKKKYMIIILIALTCIAPFILPKTVKDWARAVEYNPVRFMCNDDRIAVYRNSLQMIKAHPFLGVGAGAYMKSYKQYKESPEYRGVVTLDEMKAHNIYLHMAAEIGLVGFGVFCWLLYRLFAQMRRIYWSTHEFLKIAQIALFSGLLAFLVNGLTESSLYYSRVAMIFWFLAGVSLALKKFIPGKCQ